MIKLLSVFLAVLFFVSKAVAYPADSSVTITSAKNSYEFIYNAKASRVQIKQILSTVYSSNTVLAKLPIAELYNDNVTVDEVSARVDNRSLHNFKPAYSYYSANDIFFSDERICYFPLLLPKKGSTANVIFNETVNDPRYFTEVYFPGEYAVTHKEVSVKIPRWMNAELKEMNFGNYQIRKTTQYDSKGDADIITYVVDGLPAMQHEDNSPGPTYIYPHLLVLCKSATAGGNTFKYFGSLADQYSWYRTLTNGINDNKKIIAAKAKELTTGSNNDADKIKVIVNYVKDNIRYIAFEDGMAGFRPEKADEVLRKKYGDCKGMANLTKELLTASGFDARLCWLGTDHIAYDYQTPSLAVDNHMICALIDKGKTIYLDATETYLGMNEYAERIQGRQVLIEDGEKYILARVPYALQAQNYDYETSKLVINGNSLAGRVTHLWKGEDKESVLSGLNSVKKERSEEAMTRFLSNDNKDFVISGVELSGTDNIDKDLTVAYELDDKNAVSSFSKAYYIDLDHSKEFGIPLFKTAERKHDYWFDYKMNICKETELAIPANYKAASIPPTLDIVNPDYEFHVRYINLPGKLIYKKTIRIKNTHLSVAKFAQWNADTEQLTKTYNQNIILKPLAE